MSPPNDSPSWFERHGSINKMIAALGILCAVTVLADLFYENPHPHFDIETSFGFQAWFGFLAFAVIVFLGRVLRLIVKRDEDYYEPVEEMAPNPSFVSLTPEDSDGQ